MPKRLLVPDEFHTIKGWNAYDQSEIASRHPTSRGAKMLPPHQFLYLKSPGIDHLMKLKRHHEELHQKVFSYVEIFYTKMNKILLFSSIQFMFPARMIL